MDIQIATKLYIPMRIDYNALVNCPRMRKDGCLGVFTNERMANVKMWESILADSQLPKDWWGVAEFNKKVWAGTMGPKPRPGGTLPLEGPPPQGTGLVVGGQRVGLWRDGAVTVVWYCFDTDDFNIDEGLAKLVEEHYQAAVIREMAEDRVKTQFGIEDVSSADIQAVIGEVVFETEKRIAFTDGPADTGDIVDWAVSRYAADLQTAIDETEESE